jgi:hypothetical protein
MKWLEYERLVKIWLQNDQCIMIWVMLTTYLLIYPHAHPPLESLPTHQPIYLPIHPPTYFYNLPTYYQPSYNLLGYDINMWNKKLDKN